MIRRSTVARRFAALGGRITWGLCRSDVRCRLRVGDAVCFFGQDKDGADTYYRFCGWATVEEKIDQHQIWTDERYALFRDYLNLLVVPCDDDGLYRHQENHPGDVHPDWLKRLVCVARNPFEKDDFDRWEDAQCARTVRNGVDRTPSGQPIRFVRNYILFGPSAPETVVLANPPLVASHSPSFGTREEWSDDDVAGELRRLVLEMAVNRNRGLRSSPTGFQHAPLPLTMPANEWRKAMCEFIERHDLPVLG